MPNLEYDSFGAAFGDLDNDGYPDLVVVNGTLKGDGPESVITRLYMNVPAPTATEPGGRRFIDLTFGRDRIPSNIDDRMPFNLDIPVDVKLADFDNDGDLDMFITNVARLRQKGTGFEPDPIIGAPNRFYENIDVDDPTINSTPDADSFGDGFFRDVTPIWDPGILNGGWNTPYAGTLQDGSYGFPSPGGGFGIGAHSDVGDLDGDGDIDVVVCAKNCFMDSHQTQAVLLVTPPTTLLDGLRFSERVLINHTREPAAPVLGDLPGRTTRFADETLGNDNLFGGFTPDGTQVNDRLPSLRNEYPSMSPNNGSDEVDFSNSNAVKLSTYFASAALGDALGIVVFNMHNGPSGASQSPSGPLDGDAMVYVNLDINGDGVPDGVFECANYGEERVIVPQHLDGTIDPFEAMRIGQPEGYPSDAIAPEDNRKQVSNDQSMFGVVFDNDFTGWNEILSINSFGTHNMFCHRNFSGDYPAEFNRGRTTFRVDYPVFGGLDYEPIPGLDYRRAKLTLERLGRARGGVVADFNLDGLPDVFVANDTDSTADDIIVPGMPPGHNTFYMNQDYDNWLPMHFGKTGVAQAITNDGPHSGMFMVADDIDLDGDKDVFVGNTAGVATLYRNNSIRGARTTPFSNPAGNPMATYNAFDVPTFVDATWELLSPYMGGSADQPLLPSRISNITLAADLADIDRDGDLDLTFANGGVGTMQGDLQILYKNNGKPLNEGMHVFTPTAQPYSAPILNSAIDQAPWLSHETSRAYDVHFVDINGDGSPDILFANNGSEPRVFINTDSNDPLSNSQPDTDSVPDGVFREEGDRIPASLFTQPNEVFSRKMAIGDVDGDGLVDLVIANGQAEGAPNIILMNRLGGPGGSQPGYYVNESSTRLPKSDYVSSVTLDGPVLDNTYDVALVDVDNDGDLDIVFANEFSAAQGENFYPFCRLLLNDGSGHFTEVLPDSSPWASRIFPVLRVNGRWPLAQLPLKARKVIVADFANRGEPTEDINGNGYIGPQPDNVSEILLHQIIEATEDLNGNGVVDYVDSNGNGRHDANYDLFICTAATSESNVLLMNQDRDGDGFGDGWFADETTTRMPSIKKYPTYGGDAGDVNLDGYVDLALAISTQNDSFKIPVQLLLNVAMQTTAPEGAYFVDVSGPSQIVAGTTGTVAQNGGELPALKTQIAQGQFAGFPGNCRAVKLADIDRDGDLDMIICQAGLVGDPTFPSAPPYGGYANYILLNMTIGANFNSHQVLSVRDPGGPILRSLTPSTAPQGEKTVVTIFGQKFAGTPRVDFGPGIHLVGDPVADMSERIVVTITVDPDAPTGARIVTVTNPDGLYTTSHNFMVTTAGSRATSAADQDWQLYP